MKKRFLACLCAAVLCARLLLSLSASAADTYFFVAVNDTLLPLEDRYIPIAVSGQYYVPYTVLDGSITGVNLGIYPIYNAILNSLTIYNRDQLLRFDLTSSVCTDRSGTGYSVRSVTRNGRIYVPIRFICEYFGLTYSTNPTAYGSLLRICNSSVILDDANFVDVAQIGMPGSIQNWRQAQAQANPPAVTPAPSPVPTPSPIVTPPTPSAAVSPAPGETDPEIDKSDVRLYLAFRADQTEGLEELLVLLEMYQIKALFLFPAEELAGHDAAVRRVLCGGHGVGLLLSGTTAEEAAAQAAEGNRLLNQIAHLSTNIVLVPGAESGEARAELESAGLICLSPDVDALPDGRTASVQGAAVQKSADQYHARVTVLSDTSTAGHALMYRLLPELIQEQYSIRLLVETEF